MDADVYLLESTTYRRWRRLVLLKRAAWDRIDGETIFRPLEEALNTLSTPMETDIFGEVVVVVDYALWKQHILQYQQKREANGTDNV